VVFPDKFSNMVKWDFNSQQTTPFKVCIRQEPVKGKLCALSEPPTTSHFYPGLVVSLDFQTQQSGEFLESLNFICHIVLVDEWNEQVTNSLKLSLNDDKLKTGDLLSALIGSQTSTGIVLNDLDGQPQLFFIFPDISSRVKGKFRFHCQVIDLNEYYILT
jgi:hypothetical protein